LHFQDPIGYNQGAMKKILLLLILCLPWLVRGEIYQVKIEGPIEAIVEEYVVGALKTIPTLPNARLILLELDTPGGYDTSMRAIIKAMLDCPVPIVAYVHPRGARAASAGFFIALAADVVAMSPGTNMGAAHPVSATGQAVEKTMNEKITNDAVSYITTISKNRNRNTVLAAEAVSESKSYTAEECLKQNLADLIAYDHADLLRQLEGRAIRLFNGTTVTVHCQHDALSPVPMSGRQTFLRTITNPNLAVFLLLFGLIGLYIEFTHPGVVIPGLIGGISLLLAFLAFQILPINYVGLLLLLLAIALFIAEIKIQSFGLLGVGGIVAFILGAMMLVNSPIPEMRPALGLVASMAAAIGGIFLFLTYKVMRSMKSRVHTGSEGMAGTPGIAKTDISPAGGRCLVRGEWWNCHSDQPIAAGATIEVVAVHDLNLKVIQKGGSNE
jgi:membrane-bound serine protease (ClpP class)